MKPLLHREIVDIEITESMKKNRLYLFLFLGWAMIRFLSRTLLVKLCYIVAIGLLFWYILQVDRNRILDLCQMLVMAIAFLIVGVCEEYAHAAACIQKGKHESVRGLKVSKWKLDGVYELMIESFGIYFKGRMTYRDLLHITAAGPLFSICVGSLLFCTFWLIGIISPQTHLRNFIIAISFLLMPILSLVPKHLTFFNSAFLSDGSRILNIKRHYNIPLLELLKQMGKGLVLVLLYLFNMKTKDLKYEISSDNETNL